MTTTLFLVLSAIAPALILLVLVAYSRRDFNTFVMPRPPWLVLWALLAGVGSAYLALAVESALAVTPWSVASLGGLAAFTLFAVGLAEEGAKFIALRALLWRLKLFTEPYDGILLAATVGLGFGATENISYVLAASADQGPSGFEVALVRAFTAVPLHGMLGVVLGYYIGQARVKELADGRVRWGLLLSGLGWAVVGHGFYDFLAFQNNPLAELLLWICLAVLASVSWRLIRQAKRYSITWGGTGPEEPTLFIPPVAPPRDPRVAGILGLIPGVGQFYNGEWQKGLSLMGVAAVNLTSLLAVWLLINYPLESIFQLLDWGLTLGEKPIEFINQLANTPILWVLSGLLVSFCLFGAFDAYRTAYSRRFEYLLAPPFRVKFVQSVSLAYSGHLLLVLLFALVPLFLSGGSSGGGGQPLEFDLVQTPTTLNGHKEQPEGKTEGKQKSNRREQIAQNVPKTPDNKQGKTPVPQPKKSVKAQQAKGLPRSYSDYLSWKIRQFHDLYFSQVAPDEYTVVRYVIAQDGHVREAEVLQENSTTPPAVAELAAETIRDMDPLEPLPQGIREVEVLELFWNGTVIGKPGSLEERLSMLPDGRWVQETSPP
ncbi:PrsW family intramembrane metalloprotease [Anthocerotibacter panamensis]|uniref:PrsW family intramembrane metalloprotease n=1 Tax=Anthocerotibacter panamensis TaxID=2857077 RepID=UPI001C40312E|nr:PrsW family intramembrane metalloprotease [Anthocerotibacter panamensis]